MIDRLAPRAVQSQPGRWQRRARFLPEPEGRNRLEVRKPRFYQQSSAMLIMLAVMEDPQDVKMEVGWTTSWPSKI